MSEKSSEQHPPKAPIPREQSEVEPTIGRIVHYYPTHHDLIKFEAEASRMGGRMAGYALGKTPISAIVCGVHPGDVVDLRLWVNAPIIPPLVSGVPFSSSPRVGAWSWQPAAPRRRAAA